MLKIKELRHDIGLTQEELAEKMGLKYYNIGDWERGKCEPCCSDLIKLAGIFNVTVDYLIGNSDDFGLISPAPNSDNLSEDEKELLAVYSQLDEEDKRSVRRVARSLLSEKKESHFGRKAN